jgi:drug/metabolite transporter (DMT)-like permease
MLPRARIDAARAAPVFSAPMSPRLGALLAVIFWGVSFVATKHVVTEISPATLLVARAALGMALLAAMLRARGEGLVPPRETWPSLFLMGFIGIAVHGLLQAYALTMTSAVNTGWLVGLTPVWSALLAALTLGERMGGAKILGLLLGFAGAALVVTQGRLDLDMLRLPATRGDMLILASTLNWSVYTVLGHPTLRRLGARRATAGGFATGFLILLPLFLWQSGWRELSRLSPTGWVALLFLGIACSGLGYLFWYAALEKMEATKVAVFLYLEPVVTLLAAVLLLGESVHPLTIAGGILLLAGVVIVQRA